MVDKHKHKKHIVRELLKVNKQGMNMRQLMKQSSIPRNSIYAFLNDMEDEIYKEGQPVVYKLKEYCNV
jgi:sugar-specific transcriptional regulator TrmB